MAGAEREHRVSFVRFTCYHGPSDPLESPLPALAGGHLYSPSLSSAFLNQCLTCPFAQYTIDKVGLTWLKIVPKEKAQVLLRTVRRCSFTSAFANCSVPIQCAPRGGRNSSPSMSRRTRHPTRPVLPCIEGRFCIGKWLSFQWDRRMLEHKQVGASPLNQSLYSEPRKPIGVEAQGFVKPQIDVSGLPSR